MSSWGKKWMAQFERFSRLFDKSKLDCFQPIQDCGTDQTCIDKIENKRQQCLERFERENTWEYDRVTGKKIQTQEALMNLGRLRRMCVDNDIPYDRSDSAPVLYKKCVVGFLFQDMEYNPRQDYFWRSTLIRRVRRRYRNSDTVDAEVVAMLKNLSLVSTEALQEKALICGNQFGNFQRKIPNPPEYPKEKREAMRPPTCDEGCSMVTKATLEDWDKSTMGSPPSVGCCLCPVPKGEQGVRRQNECLSQLSRPTKDSKDGKWKLGGLDTLDDDDYSDDSGGEKSRLLKELSRKAAGLWKSIADEATSEIVVDLIYQVQKSLESVIYGMDEADMDSMTDALVGEGGAKPPKPGFFKRFKAKSKKFCARVVNYIVKNKYVIYLVATQVTSIMDAACSGVQRDFMVEVLAPELERKALSHQDVEDLVDDYLSQHRMRVYVMLNLYIAEQLDLDDVKQSVMDYAVESEVMSFLDRASPFGVLGRLGKAGLGWVVNLVADQVVSVMQAQVESGMVTRAKKLTDFVTDCLADLARYRSVIPDEMRARGLAPAE